MQIVWYIPYIKTLVLFLWGLSYTFFKKKNSWLNTKAFFEMGGFFLLSLCAALAQASSFWQIFSRLRSMELKKTKFALFVKFQSLRLESRLENWLVTCKDWLWNPDQVYCQMQEEETFNQLYCLKVLLLLLLHRNLMKCVMWYLLAKGVRGWDWGAQGPLRLC